MIQTRSIAVLVLCSVALAACNTATQVEEAPRDPNTVPELTLNLPEQEDCRCVEEPQRDYTFLERGYSALALREYLDAVEYFKSYRRLEQRPEAQWEADIAIAFVSMLPDSPLYDAEEARKSWRQLTKELTADMQVHDQAIVMHDALASFSAMDRRVTDLENDNASLREELEKREEALKRLRELTLGQRGE